MLKVILWDNDWKAKIMLKKRYDAITNEIHSIKQRRQDFENKIKCTDDEDEIIEYKFQMMKLKEKLDVLNKEVSELKPEIKEKERLQEINKAREKAYKKFYVTWDDDLLQTIKVCFQINQTSKDGIIKDVIKYYDNYLEGRIYGGAIDYSYYISEITYFINCLSYSGRQELIKILKDDNISIFNFFERYEGETIINLLDDNTRRIIKYIVKKYEGVEFVRYNKWAFEFKYDITDIDLYYDIDYDISFDNYIDSLDFIYLDDNVPSDFRSTMDVEGILSIREYNQKFEHESFNPTKYRVKREKEYKERLNRYDKAIKAKKDKDDDKIPCYSKLTEDSSIEDIANCFSEINGFNNWKYDKNPKKIVFELLRADGKNILKMKKMEIKELKKWLVKNKR